LDRRKKFPKINALAEKLPVFSGFGTQLSGKKRFAAISPGITCWHPGGAAKTDSAANRSGDAIFGGVPHCVPSPGG
jgi:hypothetical protein